MVIELNEKAKEFIERSFRLLKEKVILKVFISRERRRCLYCYEVVDLTTKIANLSDLVSVKVLDMGEERSIAERYSINMVPAILVHSNKEYGVRFFGVPVGYEFKSLIEDIIDVSRGKVDLSQNVRRLIEPIAKRVHIRVFVTPACPYCPFVVRAAHKFAILNRNITADMIESYEFPELADKYEVLAVPKIVINDVIKLEGAFPEIYFAQKILEALGG